LSYVSVTWYFDQVHAENAAGQRVAHAVDVCTRNNDVEYTTVSTVPHSGRLYSNYFDGLFC
jgi:hypothetical protein